ncbi:MAG: heavy-metal-associated domain-containing protein [Hyphomonadaceae bacterium]|nr:heavy-metal-associated domain-containing protein [Hyphomonadaceae bacterium]
MAAEEKELDVSVPSMVCDGCADKIRTALAAMPGVREVKVGLWRKRVRIRYEPGLLQPAQVTDAILAAGFPVADA